MFQGTVSSDPMGLEGLRAALTGQLQISLNQEKKLRGMIQDFWNVSNFGEMDPNLKESFLEKLGCTTNIFPKKYSGTCPQANPIL